MSSSATLALIVTALAPFICTGARGAMEELMGAMGAKGLIDDPMGANGLFIEPFIGRFIAVDIGGWIGPPIGGIIERMDIFEPRDCPILWAIGLLLL